jgi:hypothetical protein
MYRTLSELRDSINRMIEQQGENAPCAAFVFTQNDVFEYNEDDTDLEEVRHFPTHFNEFVLYDVGNSSYIYEQIGEVIEDAIHQGKSHLAPQAFLNSGV